MQPILSSAKNLLQTSVRILNQPGVKEGVKKVAGSVTFVFGLIEIYDIYQIIRGREISTEINKDNPKWMQVAHKVIILSAKISLILSAFTSPPGVFLITVVSGYLFSAEALTSAFGPNTIFAVNPWHPRHVVSIAAVILALPAVLLATYQAVTWAHKKITQFKNDPEQAQTFKAGLTDAKVKLMTLFTTATSRPTLHLGNQLGRYIFRAA